MKLTFYEHIHALASYKSRFAFDKSLDIPRVWKVKAKVEENE
jgi:hypothetical protein